MKIQIGILIATLITSPAFAQQKCAEVQGNMVVKKVTMKCLSVKGTADFDHTTILHDLQVKGTLSANSATLGSVNVTGKTSLHNSVINGVTQITGFLEAFDTTFKDKIQLLGPDAVFENSKTKGIEVLEKAKSVIHLKNTTVDGDIVFTHQKGIVENTNSTIQGKIIGGK